MTGSGAPITLRPVEDADLDVLFDQMRDPESVRMAAFTAADPGDRAAFDAHMAKVRASPEITMRALTREGVLVGSIASFVVDGRTEVTYWVDRSAWGQDIASNALKLLIELVPVRPLYARAASDNARSLRVLEKAGFRPVGTECSYAPGRGAAIEETILRRE
jgi:RimJ/RimL family protein N-acetyltransferase